MNTEPRIATKTLFAIALAKHRETPDNDAPEVVYLVRKWDEANSRRLDPENDRRRRFVLNRRTDTRAPRVSFNYD